MNRSYSKIRHIQESNMILEKRILGEEEETQSTPRACSTKLIGFFKQLASELTPEEMEAIADEYQEDGENGLEQRIEHILMGGTLFEGKNESNLESAINKIAKILAFSSVGFLSGVGLLSCLEGFDFTENVPSWLNDVLGVGIITSIPVAFASLIVAQLTEKEEKNSKFK